MHLITISGTVEEEEEEEELAKEEGEIAGEPSIEGNNADRGVIEAPMSDTIAPGAPKNGDSNQGFPGLRSLKR